VVTGNYLQNKLDVWHRGGALSCDARWGMASRMDHGSKSQINVRADGELRAQLERLARAEDTHGINPGIHQLNLTPPRPA
jgi:hypothetical protein